MKIVISEKIGLLDHWADLDIAFSGACPQYSVESRRSACCNGWITAPYTVATLPFLSPHSAVVAFCEGV